MADDLWHKTRSDEPKVACGCGGLRVPSAKHGRGKRWRARVLDANGELLQPSFDRKVDAEEFEAKVRADVARGTYVERDAGKVRLAEYAEQWLAARTFNESTREAVEVRLRLHTLPVLGGLELRALAQRPSLIQAWLGGLDKTLAPNTIGPIFANLSAILAAAVDDGEIRRNPCRLKSVSAPPIVRKKVRPWTDEQIRAIHGGLSARYATMVDAGYGLGMRQGEVFGLAVEDVQWLARDKPKVHVCRQVKIVGGKLVFGPPKFDHERDVPLAKSTHARLAAHLQQWPARAVTLPWEKPDGHPVTARLIFRNGRDGAIVRPNFNRDIWQPALRRAGITDTPGREHGYHSLRHTYASMQLASGTSIRALAEYLGHKDPAFTLRVYGHLMPDDEDRARRAVDEAYESEREEMPSHGNAS